MSLIYLNNKRLCFKSVPSFFLNKLPVNDDSSQLKLNRSVLTSNLLNRRTDFFSSTLYMLLWRLFAHSICHVSLVSECPIDTSGGKVSYRFIIQTWNNIRVFESRMKRRKRVPSLWTTMAIPTWRRGCIIHHSTSNGRSLRHSATVKILFWKQNETTRNRTEIC